jgi:glycosyltransferase involved in cell wall biosynthesis
MFETELDPLVLLTIGCLDIGGAERRLLQLIRHQRSKGTRVRVAFFVISGRKGRLEDDFKAAGCEIYHGRPGILGLIDLARLCNKTKPHILHANSETAAGFYCLVARLMRVPRIISHMRTSRERGYSRTVRDAIYERFTGFFSDIVIGVSWAALADKRFGQVSQRVIYNGLDPSELAVAKGSSPPASFGGVGPDFLVLCRLDRSKNIAHTIAAFRLFAERHGEDAGRLHIVGPEGNVSMDYLSGLAHEAGIAQRVHFHGPTSEPLRFFHHANCALLASDFEGLPGVVLEALSCGTPVVASDIPSAVEVMQHTRGMMVVAVSDVECWARSMLCALNMDRKVIEDHFWECSPFSLSRYASEMSDLWQVAKLGTES